MQKFNIKYLYNIKYDITFATSNYKNRRQRK